MVADGSQWPSFLGVRAAGTVSGVFEWDGSRKLLYRHEGWRDQQPAGRRTDVPDLDLINISGAMYVVPLDEVAQPEKS